MISSKDAAYCISCDSIVEKSSADQIFRTGFYRTTIPLCQCRNCACAEVRKKSLGIELLTPKSYTDFKQPLSLLA